MGRQSKQLAEVYNAFRDDIFTFCRLMNFEPTWQQAEFLQAVEDAKLGRGLNRIAVKSGQGPGKTTASNIAAHWCTLRNVDGLTVVTAPTARQCKDVWLAEGRRLLQKANPMLQKLVNITKSKVEVAGRPDWGVRTVTATKEENAQGFHQENMTVIVEEASGVARPIITQFKGTLSNPDSLLIQIGNPNTRDCDFHDCFTKNRDRWRCLTFNAEDTARDYPYIVSPQRNRDLEEEFGRDSDIYRVRVLGEFPHADPNCVMSSDDVEACADRSLYLPGVAAGRDRVIGIDLARFGGDESTVYRRSGGSIVEWDRFARAEPIEPVRAAFAMQERAGWRDRDTLYVVDAGGIGQGILHVLYEAGKLVHEFHNGGTAMESDKYADAITEGWFRLARMVKDRACCLPEDDVLVQQLSSRQYSTNKKGQLVLESKDQYMRRGYDSPDRADGIVYAFFDQAAIDGRVTGRKNAQRAVGSSR